MATLTIPNRFVPGVISAADIDADFAAVATLMNATKLGADNFRPLSGIPNRLKTNPGALAILHATIPQIVSSATTTQTYKGVIAYPHFAQYPMRPTDQSGDDGNVTDKNATKGPGFAFAALQGCYHGGTGVIAGDTLRADISYRKKGSNATTSASLDIRSDNALVEVAGAITPALDYVRVDVRWTAADAGARTVNHVTIALFLVLYHVP